MRQPFCAAIGIVKDISDAYALRDDRHRSFAFKRAYEALLAYIASSSGRGAASLPCALCLANIGRNKPRKAPLLAAKNASFEHMAHMGLDCAHIGLKRDSMRYTASSRGKGRSIAYKAAFDDLRAELAMLDGIGKSTTDIIISAMKGKKHSRIEELSEEIEKIRATRKLLLIPGIGLKRANVLYEDFGNLSCNFKRLREIALAGFLEWMTPDKWVEAIDFAEKRMGEKRIPSEIVIRIVTPVLEAIRKKGLRASVAGSLRRGMPVVKDADIIIERVKGKNAEKIIKKAARKNADKVESVVVGDQKIQLTLIKTGFAPLHVDFLIVKKKEWVAALQYFTGSKGHNVMVRSAAKKKGYKLNEHGLFKKGKRVKLESEKDIYDTIGIDYVMPSGRH